MVIYYKGWRCFKNLVWVIKKREWKDNFGFINNLGLGFLGRLGKVYLKLICKGSISGVFVCCLFWLFNNFINLVN